MTLKFKKSHQYPGKMTEAVYTATAEYVVEIEQQTVKHRVSVSGALKRLGVSLSGLYFNSKVISYFDFCCFRAIKSFSPYIGIVISGRFSSLTNSLMTSKYIFWSSYSESLTFLSLVPSSA